MNHNFISKFPGNDNEIILTMGVFILSTVNIISTFCNKDAQPFRGVGKHIANRIY
jgi:hypothetical protein